MFRSRGSRIYVDEEISEGAENQLAKLNGNKKISDKNRNKEQSSGDSQLLGMNDSKSTKLEKERPKPLDLCLFQISRYIVQCLSLIQVSNFEVYFFSSERFIF